MIAKGKVQKLIALKPEMRHGQQVEYDFDKNKYQDVACVGRSAILVHENDWVGLKIVFLRRKLKAEGRKSKAFAFSFWPSAFRFLLLAFRLYSLNIRAQRT